MYIVYDDTHPFSFSFLFLPFRFYTLQGSLVNWPYWNVSTTTNSSLQLTGYVLETRAARA